MDNIDIIISFVPGFLFQENRNVKSEQSKPPVIVFFMLNAIVIYICKKE